MVCSNSLTCNEFKFRERGAETTGRYSLALGFVVSQAGWPRSRFREMTDKPNALSDVRSRRARDPVPSAILGRRLHSATRR
jgi:hypothetical protein